MSYIGYSMSEGAKRAYEEGKVPFSKLKPITKQILRIITNGNPQEWASEWHHTSKYYNRTWFYDKNIDRIIETNIEKAKELILVVKKMMNEYISKKENIFDFDNEISFLRIMNTRGSTIEKDISYEMLTKYREIKRFFEKEIFLKTSNF